MPGPVQDVLDVWCGTRPYEDLLPPTARCIGLDVEGNPYGVADVVSDEFLPFPDESFDLVICIEAFQYVPDPVRAVSEFRRVLRSGGTVLVTLPFAWQYDRSILERRYTGPELVVLFEGWESVDLRENGGRAVSWTVLTGSLLNDAEQRARRLRPLRLLRPLFLSGYVVVNGLGLLLVKAEERYVIGTITLPMNLMLTARKPPAG